MRRKAFTNNGYNNWETPRWLFDRLHKEYQFDIDGASDGTNNLLPKYDTKDNKYPSLQLDGYKYFVNPPWDELNEDYWWDLCSQRPCIMLVPFTPETKMWHRWVWRNASVFIFNKRINYVHPETGIETKGIARPSALICFNLPTIEINDLGLWVKKK
jgi:hypothetical protein